MPSNSIEDEEAGVQPRDSADWRTRFQFPLYKLFLVTAAYAMSFAAFGSIKGWGIFIATWIGTSVSVWVLAVRTRVEVLRSMIATIGALFGYYVLKPVTFTFDAFGPDPDTLVWSIFDAVLGSLLFAVVGRFVGISRGSR
jgi:hypothetical protein